MKEFIKNHKWLISIFFSALILLGIITYLYFTNRLSYVFISEFDYLLDNLTKLEIWILSGSLIAVVALSLLTNWFSSFLYGYIFPSSDKKILNNTEEIIKTVSESKLKIEELLKKSKIDSRDIEQYLKELPIKKGEDETESKINEWYKISKISSDEKDLLFVIISVIFEQIKVLSQEINNLKLKGKPEIAEFLESIQKYFTEGNADKIKEAYFSKKEKLKNENIIILKQSIKATETLFAIKETKDLYQELISLEPSANNYFQFACFLQNLNYFNEAANYYQEALRIRRELVKENPRTYLPDVAMTLNNLAVLQMDKNEFPQALEKYEEALKIYRELAKENPRTYLPDVATTLNNLAILHSAKNEFPQALEKYEEALKIRRELAKENPRTYLPNVATTLNNLAILQKDKNEFPQALEKYEEALKIYRELAKENPRTYLPNLAITLNNLAGLQKDKNEFPQALEKYEEALKIRRELANENPRTYEIDYAQTLVMGVDLFKKDKGDLKKAKRMLEKYPNAYQAQKLLEIIKGLE